MPPIPPPPGHAENVRKCIVAILGFYACFPSKNSWLVYFPEKNLFSEPSAVSVNTALYSVWNLRISIVAN